MQLHNCVLCQVDFPLLKFSPPSLFSYDDNTASYAALRAMSNQNARNTFVSLKQALSSVFGISQELVYYVKIRRYFSQSTSETFIH